MNAGSHKGIALSVLSSKDPIAKGREVLLEAYRKTDSVTDDRIQVMAVFENLRSMVAEAAYEALRGTSDSGRWIEATEIRLEAEDAKEQEWYARKCGLEHSLKLLGPERLNDKGNRARLDIEKAVNGYWRFLGSLRQHIPGVGYAVTVRKRKPYNGMPCLNQDTFLMAKQGEETFFSVSDRCGSARFSLHAGPLASHETLRRKN